MGTNGGSQKTCHEDRAEDGRSRDGIEDRAGDHDAAERDVQVHRKTGFLHCARDLGRREQLHRSVDEQRCDHQGAGCPSYPTGAMGFVV